MSRSLAEYLAAAPENVRLAFRVALGLLAVSPKERAALTVTWPEDIRGPVLAWCAERDATGWSPAGVLVEVLGERHGGRQWVADMRSAQRGESPTRVPYRDLRHRTDDDRKGARR
jgi:hypothetical protein